MDRDEFPERIKRIVAERAAYLCSNPDCRALTIKPHSDSEKSVKSGVGAHIKAAAPGGPRYDPLQTEESRRGIENAVWLCHKCSDNIDKDPNRYPIQVLQNWKTDHDTFISNGGGIPRLPIFTISTLSGLTVPSHYPATITGEDVKKYREHKTVIFNPNSCILFNLKCRVQLPEPIIRHYITDFPVGSSVRCDHDLMPINGFVSGSGSIASRPSGMSPNYIIEIDKLPPKRQLEINLISVVSEFAGIPVPTVADVVTLHYYIQGEFQFLLHEQFCPRHFIVPLLVNNEKRTIVSSECEEDDGRRKLQIHNVWM